MYSVYIPLILALVCVGYLIYLKNTRENFSEFGINTGYMSLEALGHAEKQGRIDAEKDEEEAKASPCILPREKSGLQYPYESRTSQVNLMNTIQQENDD